MASKKDYVAMANVLAAEYSSTSPTGTARIAITNIMQSVANMYANDNPRFNRELFYAAVRGADND
jgi:hypothetical protein